MSPSVCCDFGAFVQRLTFDLTLASQNPAFPEEASRLNDRGNLPLHAACSFQATADVVESLLKAYPGGASQPNSAGNLPIHQAAMWQAPQDTVELLLSRHPEGATVRNQYGSLPLHMAASNQASVEVLRILIDSYPDALHLQNDDGMTPLDLALADESASEAVIAMLEGRPPPPELTRRQKAEKYENRAMALERKLASLKESGGRQGKDLHEALLCVRRLADRFPHALYAAGLDPNELEIAFSERQQAPDLILMDAVKKRNSSILRDVRGIPLQVQSSVGGGHGPRDRVEDLLTSIVGLDHVKSQVRGLRRTCEISDLKESLLPVATNNRRGPTALSLISPALSEDNGRPRANHMVFVGNPGTGKTAVARLLAKAYHELGLLRKPKFLEVERMDLVGRDKEQTILKTREVLDEARGGILFIDEAYTLGMASKRNKVDTGYDAMSVIIKSMDDSNGSDGEEAHPLIILAGFPVEMQTFLSHQPDLRKKFPITFEFPDYSCQELAKIFLDLANAKGFDMDDDVDEDWIAQMLGQETTVSWRSERNGRVCEQLMAGCRTQVRRRMRTAQMEEDDHFDPHQIIRQDIEAVMTTDFK